MSNASKEEAVREIRRRTRRRFSAEEKIRIVLEGLRGEVSVAELCRREGIASNLYYRWSKEFLEAGKKRLAGDTVREATSDEVIQDFPHGFISTRLFPASFCELGIDRFESELESIPTGVREAVVRSLRDRVREQGIEYVLPSRLRHLVPV